MNKVFFGFLFIFLDINLKLNAHSLNLLPDWLGYILLFAVLMSYGARASVLRRQSPFALRWRSIREYFGCLTSSP